MGSAQQEQSQKGHLHSCPLGWPLVYPPPLTHGAPPNPGRTKQRSTSGWGTLRAPVSTKLGLQSWAEEGSKAWNKRKPAQLVARLRTTQNSFEIWGEAWKFHIPKHAAKTYTVKHCQSSLLLCTGSVGCDVTREWVGWAVIKMPWTQETD